MIRLCLDALAITFRDPRAGLRWILSLPRGNGTEITALFLFAICSSMLDDISLFLLQPQADSAYGWPFNHPVMNAALSVGLALISAVLIWSVGRKFGGRGSLADALLAVAWLDAVMMAVQVALLLVAMTGLPLLEPLGWMAIGLYFLLMACFVAELHGFQSVARAFIAVMISFVTIVMILSILLVILIPREILLNAL